MKMKKILVIFFLATIFLFIIYENSFKKDNLYLAIGDGLALGHTPFNTYSKSYVDYFYETLNNYQINKDYIKEDIRIKDLLWEMKSEKSNNLSQLIKQANIITISIGSEELFSKIRSNYTLENNITKEYIDLIFIDYDSLLTEIRKLNKNQILIIGYYNPIKVTESNKNDIEELFSYIDNKFIELENKYDIEYIEIYNKFNDSKYLPNLKNAFPSLEGYAYIASELKKKVNF